MRNLFLFRSSLLVAGISMFGLMASAAPEFKDFNHNSRKVALAGQQKAPHFGARLHQSGATTGSIARSRVAPTLTPIGAQSATSFSFIEGPDGSSWYYTLTTDEIDWNIASAEITLYDDYHVQQGHIVIDIPAGRPVNVVEPCGPITTKMFDRESSSYEMMVYIHEVAEDYSSIDTMCVYSMTGELVSKMGGYGVLFDASANQWNTYQRLVLQHTETEDDAAMVHFDIVRPMSWSDTAVQVEHTFKVPESLIYYSDGPSLSTFKVDGEPYYVVSHYAMPYCDGYNPETYDMIVAEDNSYVLEVYDRYFDKVDSLSVPIIVPTDALYRFVAFSVMSENDLSKDYYSADGKFDFVISFYDYLTTSDDYRYDFEVYKGSGANTKTICDNVFNTYFRLSDIKGQSDQYAFMQIIDGTEQIQMVDLPSCDDATLLPAYIDGEIISTTLDRFPKGDSYQYVISMGQAETDADNNVIARIGWYNTDLTLDHFVKFNLGQQGQYFSPLLDSRSLDPYLFNTDDDHEYLFIAKIKRADSDVLDNVMVLATEQGDTISTFRCPDLNGSFTTANIFGYGGTHPELFVCYDYEDSYHFEFYPLPFSKFTAGGDGSAATPYLVSTLGDMQQMSTNPAASYKLVADIDMTGNGSGWTPIENFSGTLDGDGHQLTHLYINSDSYYAAMFGYLDEGSVVKNLKIVEPTIELTSDNSQVGVIGGMGLTDTLSNIQVSDAHIFDPTASAYATVGGLIGQSMFYGRISDCSFYRGTIDVPGAVGVGGIVGDTRTSTEVSTCVATGVFTAQNKLGGIVGTSGMASPIRDCRVDAVLTADHTVGGIVGSNTSRSEISHCYVEGSVSVLEASWNGLSAGGIVGSMASDWSNMPLTVVSGCVALCDISVPESGADATVHRIAGWTIANEYYEEGETPYSDLGMASCYALTSMTVDGQPITSADAASVEGASVEAAALTEDFLTGIGFVYGTDAASPWKSSDAMPLLYFEDPKDPTHLYGVTEKSVASKFAMLPGTLSCAGAKSLSLYTPDGCLLSHVAGGKLSTASLAQGLYVAVATDAAGRTTSAKIVLP